MCKYKQSNPYKMYDHINTTDLAKKCEDYLLQRYIPLYSTVEKEIIDHAMKEGFQIGLYLRRTTAKAI